jgi:hypothetical protein
MLADCPEQIRDPGFGKEQKWATSRRISRCPLMLAVNLQEEHWACRPDDDHRLSRIATDEAEASHSEYRILSS